MRQLKAYRRDTRAHTAHHSLSLSLFASFLFISAVTLFPPDSLVLGVYLVGYICFLSTINISHSLGHTHIHTHARSHTHTPPSHNYRYSLQFSRLVLHTHLCCTNPRAPIYIIHLVNLLILSSFISLSCVACFSFFFLFSLALLAYSSQLIHVSCLLFFLKIALPSSLPCLPPFQKYLKIEICFYTNKNTCTCTCTCSCMPRYCYASVFSPSSPGKKLKVHRHTHRDTDTDR